jgi:hypothetical protein
LPARPNDLSLRQKRLISPRSFLENINSHQPTPPHPQLPGTHLSTLTLSTATFNKPSTFVNPLGI